MPDVSLLLPDLKTLSQNEVILQKLVILLLLVGETLIPTSSTLALQTVKYLWKFTVSRAYYGSETEETFLRAEKEQKRRTRPVRERVANGRA